MSSPMLRSKTHCGIRLFFATSSPIFSSWYTHSLLTRRDSVGSIGLDISEVLEEGGHLEDTWEGGEKRRFVIRDDDDDARERRKQSQSESRVDAPVK